MHYSHAFHLTEELRGRIKAAGLQDTYFKYAEAYAEALLCIQHIRRIFDGSVSDGNTYAIRRPQLIMAELGQYFKGMAIVEARSKVKTDAHSKRLIMLKAIVV